MVREWYESVSPPEKLRHMAQLFGPLPPLRLEVPLRPAARAGPPKRGCLSPTPAPSKKKQRCHATLPRRQPQGGVGCKITVYDKTTILKRPAQSAASAPCRQPRGVKRPAQPAAGAPPRQRPAQPAASAPRRQPRGVERPAQPAASPPQKRSRPSEGEERSPPKKAKLAARLRWLQSLLPIRQEAPESWFQRRVLADGSSRWGCKVCAVHAAGKGADGLMRRISSLWQLQRFQLRPKAARLPNLRRHGQSQSHAVATKAYLSGGVVDSGAGAALPEDFHSVWHRLGGRPFQKTLSQRKNFTIEWCILEAL